MARASSSVGLHGQSRRASHAHKERLAIGGRGGIELGEQVAGGGHGGHDPVAELAGDLTRRGGRAVARPPRLAGASASLLGHLGDGLAAQSQLRGDLGRHEGQHVGARGRQALSASAKR